MAASLATVLIILVPGFLSYSWTDINLPELRHVTDTKEQCVEQLACRGFLAVHKTDL